MAITQVQVKGYASTASASSHNVVLNSAPIQNNTLILDVTSNSTVNTPSGWTLAIASVDFTGTYIYYKTAGAGESATITVSPTASDSLAAVAYEYSGIITASQLDKTANATGQGGGGSLVTGTTATTTQASELLIIVAGLSSGGGQTLRDVSSWSNSFVTDSSQATTGSPAGSNVRCVGASLIVAATSTYSSTATLTGVANNASGAIATFKAQLATSSITF